MSFLVSNFFRPENNLLGFSLDLAEEGRRKDNLRYIGSSIPTTIQKLQKKMVPTSTDCTILLSLYSINNFAADGKLLKNFGFKPQKSQLKSI